MLETKAGVNETQELNLSTKKTSRLKRGLGIPLNPREGRRMNTLTEQAYAQGFEDGKNGYPGPDQVDIAHLILQVPVQTDDDGFPTEATRMAEKAIENNYANGYSQGKSGQEEPRPLCPNCKEELMVKSAIGHHCDFCGHVIGNQKK